MNLSFFEIVIIILLLAKIGDFIDYNWMLLIALYVIGLVVNAIKLWCMEKHVRKSTRRF